MRLLFLTLRPLLTLRGTILLLTTPSAPHQQVSAGIAAGHRISADPGVDKRKSPEGLLVIHLVMLI